MDPTARADMIASDVRDWYEAHRESWWQRNMPVLLGGNRRVPATADNFMLGLVQAVNDIEAHYPR